MLHHYPRPLEVVVEDKAPRPYEPGYTFDCSLVLKGPPDGSTPTFPAGSSVNLWYYRVTLSPRGGGATLYGDYWDVTPYLGGNEYIGDNGTSISKIGPISISLAGLTWSEIPTPWGIGTPPPWLRTWKSNVVLSMQGHEWEGGWNFTEAWTDFWNAAPEGEEPIWFTLEHPAEITFNGPWTTSSGPFYTDLSDASVSAIAASSGDVNNSNWTQFPTGFLTSGNNNYIGILGSVAIIRKGYSDYLSEGGWYSSATITESEVDVYPVNSEIDPYIRPAGFTLTGQTAVSRTWTRGQNQSFTITLSTPFDFIAWKEQQYPEMYPVGEPDPFNPPPPEKDRRWFDATDCGDFIISRVGEPATGTTELSGVQGVTDRKSVV